MPLNREAADLGEFLRVVHLQHDMISSSVATTTSTTTTHTRIYAKGQRERDGSGLILLLFVFVCTCMISYSEEHTWNRCEMKTCTNKKLDFMSLFDLFILFLQNTVLVMEAPYRILFAKKGVDLGVEINV